MPSFGLACERRNLAFSEGQIHQSPGTEWLIVPPQQEVWRQQKQAEHFDDSNDGKSRSAEVS